MDTNDKRRTASVTRVILCSTSILLWAFVSRPAMAQFTVMNSSNTDTLFVVTPDGNLGGARNMHGYIVADGLALSGNNDKRGAIWFATPGDPNLALYNNYSNIDKEGQWDGIKWNSVEGFNFRVESGGDPPYISTIYIQTNFDGTASVGIGTTSPQGALDVASTKGAFIVPRMSTEQRQALSLVNGMIIYNTDTNQFNFREADQWVTKSNNNP